MLHVSAICISSCRMQAPPTVPSRWFGTFLIHTARLAGMARNVVVGHVLVVHVATIEQTEHSSRVVAHLLRLLPTSLWTFCFFLQLNVIGGAAVAC